MKESFIIPLVTHRGRGAAIVPPEPALLASFLGHTLHFFPIKALPQSNHHPVVQLIRQPLLGAAAIHGRLRPAAILAHVLIRAAFFVEATCFLVESDAGLVLPLDAVTVRTFFFRQLTLAAPEIEAGLVLMRDATAIHWSFFHRLVQHSASHRRRA